MNTPEFNKIVTDRMSKIELVLAGKAAEYATEDRLHNFKTAAIIDGITPKRALWGMFMKHFVSVQDMALDRRGASVEMVDEKIGDAINYLVLLEAVIKEELAEKQNKGVE